MEVANILIIDDDADIRYTIGQICDYKGWHAFKAEGLAQAMSTLKEKCMDVIIVDYHMPNADGIQVVKEIRKLYSATPIIVLTVEETEDVFRRFIEAGADDYSIKPVKPVDLIARIQAHLKFTKSYRDVIEKDKGIDIRTLRSIITCMAGKESYVTIEDLEKDTGISRKSLYRYLQHMLQKELVEQKLLYGKPGRPKAYFRLI